MGATIGWATVLLATSLSTSNSTSANWQALLRCELEPEMARGFIEAQRPTGKTLDNAHIAFTAPRLRAFGFRAHNVDARPFGPPLLWIYLSPRYKFERVIRKVQKQKTVPDVCSQTFSSRPGRIHTCNFDLPNGNWLQVTRAYENHGGVVLSCLYGSRR